MILSIENVRILFILTLLKLILSINVHAQTIFYATSNLNLENYKCTTLYVYNSNAAQPFLKAHL